MPPEMPSFSIWNTVVPNGPRIALASVGGTRIAG